MLRPRPTAAPSAVLAAALVLAVALVLPAVASQAAPDPQAVGELVAAKDWQGVRDLGPEVMPVLVDLYRAAVDPDRRADVANFFYWLEWKSEDARQALLEDAHTGHRRLRLAVQWALGKVSNDETVVDTLLATMAHDPDPLFRDKAACGLASDQVHLTEAQKLRLFTRLVDLLESEDPETRILAIRVLHVHTGQVKGFHAGFPDERRAASVKRWRQWLDEYRAAA